MINLLTIPRIGDPFYINYSLSQSVESQQHCIMWHCVILNIMAQKCICECYEKMVSVHNSKHLLQNFWNPNFHIKVLYSIIYSKRFVLVCLCSIYLECLRKDLYLFLSKAQLNIRNWISCFWKLHFKTESWCSCSAFWFCNRKSFCHIEILEQHSTYG